MFQTTYTRHTPRQSSIQKVSRLTCKSVADRPVNELGQTGHDHPPIQPGGKGDARLGLRLKIPRKNSPECFFKLDLKRGRLLDRLRFPGLKREIFLLCCF